MRLLSAIITTFALFWMATPATAQSAPEGWWAPRGPAYDGYEVKRGKGPPFCRNGQGHPVHGMAWCDAKGWTRVEWTDVILRDPTRGYFEPTLRQPSLIEILGDVVLGRVTDQASRLRLEGPMEGRWIETEAGPKVLQLRVGDSPLAEFTDIDGDRRADVVLMIGN